MQVTKLHDCSQNIQQTDIQTSDVQHFFALQISRKSYMCALFLISKKIDIQHCNKQVQITQRLIISPTKLQTFLQLAASNNLNHKYLDQKMIEFQVTKEVSFSIRQILSHPRKKETQFFYKQYSSSSGTQGGAIYCPTWVINSPHPTLREQKTEKKKCLKVRPKLTKDHSYIEALGILRQFLPQVWVL